MGSWGSGLQGMMEVGGDPRVTWGSRGGGGRWVRGQRVVGSRGSGV